MKNPFPWFRSSEKISLSPNTLFARIKDKSDENYYYWNGNILGTPLLQDIIPFNILSPTNKTSQLMIWIGEQKVTAQTHYDIEYNFYVQVFGRKKWIMFPPEAHWELYLFPRLSPHYRQSQVSLLAEVDKSKYPLFISTKPYQVKDQIQLSVIEETNFQIIRLYWKKEIFYTSLLIGFIV